MAKTGITVPDEVLDEFDDLIWEYQKEDVLPRGRFRSTLITKLMVEWVNNHEEWIEEHDDWIAEQWDEGNGNQADVIS